MSGFAVAVLFRLMNPAFLLYQGDIQVRDGSKRRQPLAGEHSSFPSLRAVSQSVFTPWLPLLSDHHQRPPSTATPLHAPPSNTIPPPESPRYSLCFIVTPSVIRTANFSLHFTKWASRMLRHTEVHKRRAAEPTASTIRY